ncbi:hypothetical protein BJV82DRAFT_663312 [Fennellomyces sp. T-0311]|nr:hypothetical protein BJV82DRAFT_663312 [Fennellomyces sp. T-0311]
MLPWSDKGGGSSSTSIQRDENLATGSQYRPAPPGESSRFRSQPQQPPRFDDHGFDTFGSQQQPRSNPLHFPSMQQAPLMNDPAPSMNDGADIQAFLNSTAYTDELYGDDLAQTSVTYGSHRHQVDHAHAVAEQQRKHQWQDLLQAEDIVAYLQEMRYTDDIYGAPPAVEALIKEAQKEIAEPAADTEQSRVTAVDRLAMVRNHLMGQAGGRVEEAVKQGQQMQQDDWEQIFSKGGLL